MPTGLRGSLGVRVRDSSTDRTVSQQVSDLRFTKTAPGGHHSGSLTLKMPRETFPNLGPADKVFIYDTRNGRTVMEGYTENPGTGDGNDGQTFELSFNGGLVLASDRTERLIYIDATIDSWRQDTYFAQASSGQAEVGTFPDGAGTRAGQPALFCQFNSGSPITTNKQVGLVYDLFVGSPMTLGAFGFIVDGGQVDGNYHLETVSVPHLAAEPVASDTSQTTTENWTTRVAPTGFPYGKNGVVARLARRAGGATNVATENVWGAFGQMIILGQFQDRYGTLLNRGAIYQTPDSSGAYKINGYVVASEVVEDLLGRMLTFCDPSISFVEATLTAGVNAQIDQLAWGGDPVSAAGVFDELSNHEPNYLWEILETGTTGLHRFNYRAWPAVPRYEVSTRDGYDAPGGDVDLCNRIIVNWTDTNANPHVTVIGNYVPQLGNMSPVAADGSINPAFLGRIKDADPITLPDGRGSAVNAARIGGQVLAGKATAQKAGTVTINYPILDRFHAVMVQPWEIVPGYLVRVRETGDDLRLTEVEYQDSSGAATLTLGTPQLTDDQILASIEPRLSQRG